MAAYADGAALFLSVVLDSPDRYGESLSLLQYAADRYALLDLAEAGQPLAYAADRLWRAAGDLLVLVEQEHMNQLMLRWSLPDETGRFLLQVVDASGAVLGTVELI